MKYNLNTDAEELTNIGDASGNRISIIAKEDTTIFTRSNSGLWHILASLNNDTEGVLKLYAKHTNATIWQELMLYIRFKNGIVQISSIVDKKGDVSYAYLDRIAIVRNSSGTSYIQVRNHLNRYDYTNTILKISFVGTGFNPVANYTAGDVLSNWAYSSYFDSKATKESVGNESDVTLSDI
jgi:hypothetical protein